jgi:hypothetical protein
VKGNVTATGTVSGSSFLLGGIPFAFGSSANSNVFLGFAGNSSITGKWNTATGLAALESDTTGYSNTAYGYFALGLNLGGSDNTAIGASAMSQNVSGILNVASGVAALEPNKTGNYNTADGYDALGSNTTGSSNTAVGMLSGVGNATGSANTFLGAGSGVSVDPLSNATAIGANAIVGESNAMILGGIQTHAVTVGIGTSTPYNDYALDIDTTNSNGIINGGVVVNANGGNLYLGMTNGTHKFRVDTNGEAYADGGFLAGGADFAESVAVRGSRSEYEPGDVLEIDQDTNNNLAISHHSYSTMVAGIYSSKPGVLATPHTIDDARLKSSEVPLAVIGIVPCKVTTENGPIVRGDLLVTSSKSGYAMRGTDRNRMLGAVVGKALESLPSGNGVIQVLVTLQ